MVIDTQEYIKKVEDDLQSNNTYKRLTTNKLTTVNNKVKKMVKEMHSKGIIDDKLRQYMMPGRVHEGKVKANPKMHKPGAPIRTIISGTDHPTEKMAEVAESQLEEWVTSLPSYIKDTTHFLQKVEEENKRLRTDQILMFAMDVKTLYPSIPRQKGMDACKDALDKRTGKSIPTDATMLMIQTVLENNIFTFNRKSYLQMTGTAIGSRLGRNYACTYMGKWEEEHLTEVQIKPTMYVRYVDDIFGLWSDTEDELKEFHKTARNNIDENMKVDLRVSNKEIEFLDVLVKNNKLEALFIISQQINISMFTVHPNTPKQQRMQSHMALESGPSAYAQVKLNMKTTRQKLS